MESSLSSLVVAQHRAWFFRGLQARNNFEGDCPTCDMRRACVLTYVRTYTRAAHTIRRFWSRDPDSNFSHRTNASSRGSSESGTVAVYMSLRTVAHGTLLRYAEDETAYTDYDHQPSARMLPLMNGAESPFEDQL